MDQPATRPDVTHCTKFTYLLLSSSYSSPEREDDQPGDHEDHGKEDEDDVTGTCPSSVIKHLPRLTKEQRLQTKQP